MKQEDWGKMIRTHPVFTWATGMQYRVDTKVGYYTGYVEGFETTEDGIEHPYYYASDEYGDIMEEPIDDEAYPNLQSHTTVWSLIGLLVDNGVTFHATKEFVRVSYPGTYSCKKYYAKKNGPLWMEEAIYYGLEIIRMHNNEREDVRNNNL